jgi:hypothetical protein
MMPLPRTMSSATASFVNNVIALLGIGRQGTRRPRQSDQNTRNRRMIPSAAGSPSARTPSSSQLLR